MSIEEQRARFEAWMRNGSGEMITDFITRKDAWGIYENTTTLLAWQVWQSALDSVCVELPKQFEPVMPYACYEGGWNDAIDIIKYAIHAAGVKTK